MKTCLQMEFLIYDDILEQKENENNQTVNKSITGFSDYGIYRKKK